MDDRTIGDVVKKLCEQAKVQLELNPAFKETKDFICQYEESDFDFIRRLAHSIKSGCISMELNSSLVNQRNWLTL